MNPELTTGAIAEDSANLGGLIKKILYHWPLYLIMIILSIVFSVVYLKYKKPIYASTAKIYIKDDKGGNDPQSMQNFSLFTGTKVVDNEMEVIKSPIILEEVIKNNNFNIRYFQKGRLTTQEVYSNPPLKVNILTDSSKVGNYLFDVSFLNDQKITVKYNNNANTIITYFNRPFTINKDRFSISYNPDNSSPDVTNYQIQIDSILPLAYLKSDEITTSISNRGGSVFQLNYEDQVAKRTADFLNAVLTTYNNYTLEDKNKIALNTIKFIDTRLQSLGGELSTVEKDVANFKKARGITEIGENSQLYIDQVKDADQRLNVANLQLDVYNQIENYINNPVNDAPLTPALGNVDQSLVAVINRFQDLLREKSRLSLSLQPNNQIIQNLDQQINDARQTIKSYVTNYRRSAITTKSGLEKTVNQIEGKISQVPGYEREFINIKRQQGVKEGLYSYLLQKREESAVVSASNIIDNKIISPAYIPVSPVRPNRNIVILVFIISGFLLTTFYLFLKYSLNKNVTDKQYLKSEYNVPLLAEIFEQTEDTNSKVLSERSVLREQMLNLRNNLKFIINDVKGSPVILFTSSISGEGKTFLSSHLGSSLTFNNNKVILLELDLRKPKLSKSLGIDNSSGITNYLIGRESIDQIIKKVSDTEGLYVIPSGPVPPNPVELLESERMKVLFEDLKARFQYIIVDTSPIGLVSDAKSLSSIVDCLLFVVRFNYTPKVKLKEVFEDLSSSDFKKKAILFNGVNIKTSYGYTYGYSNYGYGYGNNESQSNLLSSFWKGVKQRMF